MPDVDIEQWFHMYEQMFKIRTFEERVNELYMSAKMPGLAHLYTGEIASVIGDGAFYYLDAPVRRIAAMNVPIPFSPALEDLTIPNAEVVCETAKYLCGRS